MGCLSQYANAEEYQTVMCENDTVESKTEINAALETTAAEINMTLATVGACDCTFSSYGLAYLKKVNIIMTALLDQCPCSNNFSIDEKRIWADWVTEQMSLIRSGELELCQGYTGASVPHVDWAEVGWTPAVVSKIVRNRAIKEE